jgi:Flp pilus assembly protein TadD
VKSDSTLLAGHDALGFLYLDLGHVKEARAAYSKLIELQPSDGRTLLFLGWMEFIQGRLVEAVRYWDNARAVDPMNGTVAGDMMLVELLFGDVERAGRWNEVQSGLPMLDGIGGFSATRLLLAQGKGAEALESAERQLADNPRSTPALRMAARASMEAGKLQRARQYFEELDRSARDDWDWWGTTYRTSYAHVLSQLGETARAQGLLERTLRDGMRLIAEGDERPGLRREIAAIHAAMGHRDVAYEWLERAIDAGWRHEALEPSPLLEPLRAEPRFKALMVRIDADIGQARERVRREKLGPPLPSG